MSLLGAAALLAGCGQSGTSDPTASTASPSTASPSTASPSGSPSQPPSQPPSRPPSSPTRTPSTTPSPSLSPAADVVINVEVAGDRVRPNAENVDVKKGQSVQVRLTSDVAESIHVHGYDKSAEASAGKPGSVTFTADVQGVFEVETHETEKLVAKLIVS